MKGLIFASFKLLPRAGGSSTYLYNLRQGLERTQINDIFIISASKESHINGRKEIKDRYLAFSIRKWLKSTLLNIFPSALAQLYIINHKIILKHTAHKQIIKVLMELTENDIRFIHFHSVYDIMSFFIVRKKLPYPFSETPVILTSHSPEATHREVINLIQGNFHRLLQNDISKERKLERYINKLERYYQMIDFLAFQNSDYLMFPCEESTEPYFETWKEFERLFSQKKVFYVPTGVERLPVFEERDFIREKYNIPVDSFVVSYVGRHTKVKGYDLLCEAAEEVWKKNSSIYFLIAGKQEPLKGPKDKRWVEVGWTNDPGSIINAADVFVLPNRRTYFDLVLLEVMSIGKPVIASKTGGNKFVARQSEGVLLFEELTPRSLAQKILEVASCSKSVLDKLGQKNLETYERFYTVELFAKRYRKEVGKLFFGE